MNPSKKKVAVIITAAGNSTRMGGDVKKEYMSLGNGTVLSSCVKAFVDAAKSPLSTFVISHLIITVPEDGSMGAVEAVSAFFNFDDTMQELVQYIQGGKTRQLSVYNAMDHLKQSNDKPDIVLVHDGARPFVTERLINEIVMATIQVGAAVPAIPVTDTIKEVGANGLISKHLSRKSLVAVQTPQGFTFVNLLYAHIQAITDNYEYTDDSEIYGRYCGKVQVVPGDIKNIKITYPGDLERAKSL